MILSPQFMLASELIETVVQLSDCYDKKLIDSILHHWLSNEKPRYYSSPQRVSLFQIS